MNGGQWPFSTICNVATNRGQYNAGIATNASGGGLILKSMPELSDPLFRTWFYQRWGRENCIIAARTRRAIYPAFTQRLSIKAAAGGREDYFVDGQRIAVNDDTYLILNDGRCYESALDGDSPVLSFSIFFRPGMAEEVSRLRSRPQEKALEYPEDQSASMEFSERLRRHDRQVTPLLRLIRQHVEAGVTDEGWFEERLYDLLERMLCLKDGDQVATNSIDAVRASTRKELFRRAGLGVNFISTHFDQPIGLAEISAACCLSRYHCLRIFRSAFKLTPTAFLARTRIQAAERMLRESRYPVEQVAEKTGFVSRTTLFRQLKMLRGVAPSSLRGTVIDG